MNIFFKKIKKILSIILKTINDIPYVTIFLFIELFLWIANINIRIALFRILIEVLCVFLMCLITFLELPLILLSLGIEKFLSKHIDITQPGQNSKAQYNVHEESCIPFKQSAEKTEKVILKTEPTESEKVQIKKTL